MDADPVGPDPLEALLGLLGRLRGGGATLVAGGEELVRLDADRRVLTLDLAPLKRTAGDRTIREMRPSLGRAFRWAHALHAAGWGLSVRDGGRPLVRLGAGANPLLGYVHLEPRGLAQEMRGGPRTSTP